MTTQKPHDRPLRAQDEVVASREANEADNATAGGHQSVHVDHECSCRSLEIEHLLQATSALVAIVHHSEQRVQLADIVHGRVFRDGQNGWLGPIDLEDAVVGGRGGSDVEATTASDLVRSADFEINARILTSWSRTMYICSEPDHACGHGRARKLGWRLQHHLGQLARTPLSVIVHASQARAC